MAKYDVRVRYTFEGTYKVVAEDRDEAERIVTEDCGLVLGGNIHTTRDDDEVTDWRFSSHPDMQILSFRERVDKGKVRYTSMCFSDRIEELRKDIIEAIRQLLDAHGLKKSRLPTTKKTLYGSSGLTIMQNHTSVMLQELRLLTSTLPCWQQ